MLNRFKGYFSFQSPYHKKLCQSSLLSNSDELVLDDLLFLIACFEQGCKDYLKKNTIYYIEEYFKQSLNDQFMSHYLIRSKILLTTHLMLHEFQIGVDFASTFLDQKFTYLQQLHISNDSEDANKKVASIWITLHVQLPYYQYLQRLALNIQVFLACKVNKYPMSGDKDERVEVQTKLLWLFKISNMINNGLAQMDSVKLALVQHPKELLLKEIALVYWSDIIVYYNFLSKEIQLMLDFYQHLKPNISLQFYELYLQLFQTRHNINELYKFRKHFDRDNVITLPSQMEQLKHKEIDSYMNQQRTEHSNKKKKQFLTERILSNPATKKVQGFASVAKQNQNLPVKLNLEKLRVYNEQNVKQEKIIQTHRPGRKYSFDDQDEEDFEKMKLDLQKQNIEKAKEQDNQVT